MLTTAVLLAAVGAALGVRSARRRRGDRSGAGRDLATLAMHLARGARSGLTTPEVLEVCAPRLSGAVAGEVATVRADMSRGHTFEDALHRWHRRALRSGRTAGLPDAEGVALLGNAARFAHRQGAGEAEVFESVVTALLDRAEVAEEVRALTAQARASVLVLCALPLVGLAMLGTIEADVLPALVTTTPGAAALVTATILDAGALRIGSRMVGRVLR